MRKNIVSQQVLAYENRAYRKRVCNPLQGHRDKAVCPEIKGRDESDDHLEAVNGYQRDNPAEVYCADNVPRMPAPQIVALAGGRGKILENRVAVDIGAAGQRAQKFLHPAAALALYCHVFAFRIAH